MSNGTPSRKRRARDLVDLTFLSLSRRIQAEGLVDRSHVYPTRSASPQFIRPTAANIPKTSARRNQNAELNSAHGTPTTPRARRSNGNASTSKAKLVAPSLRIVQNEDSESSEEESPPPSTSKAKAKPKVKSKSNEEELSPSKKLENWNHETMSNEDKQFIERVKKLKAAGRWSSSKAISPPEEPDRAKTHWDFLLEEVKWMYLDFKNERHIHQLYTKKISTAVLKYHKDLNKNLYDENDERAKKEREKEAKKVCSTIAKMVREFWQKAETVVDFGQKEMDEAKKREALDKHLNLLVDEADLLSKSINVESDFENEADENDAGAGLNKLAELKALKSDANIHLDDILSHLPEGYLESYHTSKRLNGTEKIVEEPMTNGVKSKEESAEPMEISREARKLEVNGEEEVVEKDSSATQTPDIPMEVDEKAKKDRSDALDQIAAEAEQFQPKGNTLATAEVTIQHPVLIDGHLREYQLVGLQWLFSLYEKNLNGILADEMGLGKTIQTIALFAHLAAEHSVWGPHLIVVPTSVILNWEMEFKKWCPSVKVLTYFGSAKERAEKRKGWMANKSFDVCITSYKLYTQDVRCFKRKQWQYLVLDEAQHIKNFESQRWQSLINLRTRRRLLLTGTPLQNNLLELWSLLHFLMPRVFTSRDDFKLSVGRQCVENYMKTSRCCVFAHDELILNLANTTRSLSLGMLAAVYNELEQIYERECRFRRDLGANNINRSEFCEFGTVPDDDRSCTICGTTLFVTGLEYRPKDLKKPQFGCSRHWRTLTKRHGTKDMLIGQTKSVTIYRLISSNTIEENILKKAREKRRLGEITIDEGGFTPQFFKKADNIRDLFFDEDTNPEAASVPIAPIMAVASEEDLKLAMERAEDRQDVIAAKRAEAEIVAEEIEFDDKSNFNYTDQSNDEFMQIVRMLRPIEQYAVQFLSKEYRPENYKVPLPNGEVQSAENSNPMILESQPRKKKVNFVKKPVGPSTIQTRNRKTRATR
uniref:Helicase SWR1 n=1 Tax=Bursaphelenchus xylophilus TaxID=6326 RepID=A0A1I7SBV9_BURXY